MCLGSSSEAWYAQSRCWRNIYQTSGWRAAEEPVCPPELNSIIHPWVGCPSWPCWGSHCAPAHTQDADWEEEGL